MSADQVIETYEPGHELKLSHVLLALGHIAAAGALGLTTEEVGQALWPGSHSATSWACSPLNKLRGQGKIVLLSERRGGQRVYVLPSMAAGRKIEAMVKRRGHCSTCTCDI